MNWTVEGTGQKLSLVTPMEFALLPHGTKLTSILGKEFVVGEDEFDPDTRLGFMAYGHAVQGPSAKAECLRLSKAILEREEEIDAIQQSDSPNSVARSRALTNLQACDAVDLATLVNEVLS